MTATRKITNIVEKGLSIRVSPGYGSTEQLLKRQRRWPHMCFIGLSSCAYRGLWREYYLLTRLSSTEHLRNSEFNEKGLLMKKKKKPKKLFMMLLAQNLMKKVFMKRLTVLAFQERWYQVQNQCLYPITIITTSNLLPSMINMNYFTPILML